MQKMRKDAVVGFDLAEKGNDTIEALQDFRAIQKAALDARQQRHDAETAAATGDSVAIVVPVCLVAALAGQAAHRVREVPEIFQRLPLHEVEQVGIRQAGALCHYPALHSMVAAASRSEEHTSELQSLMRISYAV